MVHIVRFLVCCNSFSAFTLGTLIGQSQHRLSGLRSSSHMYTCVKLKYFSAFTLGTLIGQSQHRLSGLKSSRLRLFTSIWLACILSIMVCLHNRYYGQISFQNHNCRHSKGRLPKWCDVGAHCSNPSSTNW